MWQLVLQITKLKAWPTQCLVALITLSPKPQATSMRPVALLTLVYRLVTKMLRPSVSEWDSIYSEDWDWAVRGRGAESAAYQETLEAELIVLSGGYLAGGLVDMSKFFDFVGVGWLLRTAVGLNFPQVPLILGLEVIMSYRIISVQNSVQEVGMAGNGVVPGDPFRHQLRQSLPVPNFGPR